MRPDTHDRLMAALRGDPPADDTPDPAHRAGMQLRRLMLEELHANAPASTTAAADDALMARLRAAGAFRPPQRRWPTFSLHAWLALPALASALGVSVLLLQAPVPEPGSAWRGGAAVLHLRAADPAARAAELQALFARHGQAVRRLDLPDGAGIELQARVPADATALRAALAERGVLLPANGQLVLRVSRP